jgi:protease IV
MKTMVRVLAILGALVILFFAVAIFAAVARKGHVSSKTILEADFEQEMIEDAPDTAAANVMLADRTRVRDVVDALDRGANDDRVVGLVARIGAAPMPLAQVQEIREALQRFRSRKKFAVAYAETFGEFGPGNGAYYLATAFDQIYLQPSGDVGLTGIIMESPFVKGTIDKLGMKFRGDHRYEYKNALNFYTESKYTAPHKEAMEKVMNSWFGQMKAAICEARHFSPDQFQALVDAGPYLGKEALDAKLVDGLAYRDEVYDQVKKKAGDGAELLYLSKYLDRAGRPHDKGKTVALIYGVGGVTRGKSNYSPVDDSLTMGSDTVAAAFRAAVADKDVKAILFRVDSPGGSYVASDTIWREVVRARKAGKPVIVSMGYLAGSGGYFVAMAADKIVAQPGTITASIGVLGGKFLTTGLWDKVGLSWDEVHAGANATMFTGTHDYSPAEWKRFEDWLDRVYVDFTGKVSDGRKLPKERVLQIAKGRIWSGEDAKALGLVDELGGFDTALKLVKQEAKIPDADDVKLVVFPHRKTTLESLLQREGPDNSEKEAAGDASIQLLRALQPIMRRLNAAGIIKATVENENQNDDVLKMPALEPPR